MPEPAPSPPSKRSRTHAGSSPSCRRCSRASGCAALIYQLVWLERLALAIGSSAPSLGVVLATFMGGLGLGSLLASRSTDGASPLEEVRADRARARRARPRVAVRHSAARRGVCGFRRRQRVVARRAASRRRSRALAGHDADGRDVARRRGLTSARARAARPGSAGSTPRTRPAACSAPSSRRSELLRVHDAYVATYVAVALNLGVAAAAALLARRHAPARALPPPKRRRARRARAAWARSTRGGAVGHDGAGGGGALDSASFATARRHGLHVRADPRRAAARARRSAAPRAPPRGSE